MATTWTKRKTERVLNEQYAQMDDQHVAESLLYLTNPERKGYCSLSRIKSAIMSETVGALLRKMDPIAFNVIHNEWRR